MSETHDCVYSIVDYHALTTVRDREALNKNIVEACKDLVAIGINPNKVVLFKQSDVREHTELAWVFECLVSVPFLQQAHAFKDKVAKGIEATAGLFNYPMLMAADILLYDTDVVPVGEDQRQHIEYAREAAAKFNNAYGQTFKEPKEMILKEVGVVPGTDGQKMSKSYGNTIPLFGSREDIQKAVMGIVTDSSGERPQHVYNIHKHFKSEGELEKLYAVNQGNYKALKEALVEDIDAFIAPMRERRDALDLSAVRTIFKSGAEAAQELAGKKMQEVRQKLGIAI
jgi:tryptophanyl-tRNA synthetase